MNILNCGKESGIDKYMNKFMVMKTIISKLFTCHVTYVFLILFAKKTSSILLDERNEHLANRRVERQMTDNPKSRPDDVMEKRSKRHVEEHTPGDTRSSKIKKQGRSFSQALEDDIIVIFEEGKAGK